MNRVVVTGIGVVASNGCGKNEFLNSVKNGISGVKNIPDLESLNFGCQIGGIPDITRSSYLPVLKKYDMANVGSTVLLATMAGLEAWEDAGLSIPEYNSTNVDADTGVIVGTGSASMDLICNTLIPLVNEGKVRKIRSSIVEQLLFSAPGAFLSGILATGNISTTNSSACATGTESILMGYDAIRYGKAKRILAGSSEGYSPYYWAYFDSVRVTATAFNESPEKGSRPMSATACGLVPAAGAGMLILEDLSSALQRNAPIYAEIGGGFMNSGGQRNGGTMTSPSSSGVQLCISQALKSAKTRPEEIDCISGHLSSTMADVFEIQNWVAALKRDKSNFPYINSLKSMTGHSLGASGAIETIAAVMEIDNQFIHPSINCEDVHPEISEMIHTEKIPRTLITNKAVNTIAKTSFGFGDVNVCLILKKYK
ncbi:MAG: beta-ketoacyl-[acyl-carrier-protein] synthase family protein [Bacteroidota bacterium]